MKRVILTVCASIVAVGGSELEFRRQKTTDTY